MNKYLGGVILFEETVDQKAQDGTPLPKLLMDAGIIPGIKLDKVLHVFNDDYAEQTG